jgi:hypothetical protein
MSFASIGIKTTIPATAPAATSGAVTFTSIDDENWLQISGDASAGSGSLYLLRWYPDLAEWRVYMEDKPMSVNSATFSGQFSGHYPFPSREESFVLYDPAAAITATASAARTSSPLAVPTASGGGASGGATEAKQDAGNASLVSILGQLDSKTSTLATASAQTTGNSSLSSIDGKVATAAKQDTGNTSLSSIDSKVATAANQTAANSSLSSIDTKLSAFSSGTGTVSSVNCTSAADLFASNSSAKSRWIYNPIGNGTLYVRLGSGSHTGVATSSFSVEGGQFICIFPLDYKGVVQGLLAAGSQTIQATEVA